MNVGTNFFLPQAACPREYAQNQRSLKVVESTGNRHAAKHQRRSRNMRGPKTGDEDFGLAHTSDSVETARASGPAPGRTLHRKSGSSGAEGQLAKNLYTGYRTIRELVKQ